MAYTTQKCLNCGEPISSTDGGTTWTHITLHGNQVGTPQFNQADCVHPRVVQLQKTVASRVAADGKAKKSV